MAGSASNWFKPTAGPYKGQAVYLSQAQRGGASRALILRQLAAGGVHIDRAVNRDRPAAAAQATPRARLTDAPLLRALVDDGPAPEFKAARPGSGDAMLTLIASHNGFGGARPQVVDRATLDRLVAAGGEELWRGIGGSGRRVSGAAHHRQLREGVTYYGNGIYGQGIYFASSGVRGAERVEARTVARSFMSYNSTTQPVAVRAVLRGDARVIDHAQVQAEMTTWRRAEVTRLQSAARRPDADHDRLTRELEYVQAVSRDEGYFAAMRGYDAIRIGVGEDTGGIAPTSGLRDPGQLVILNRGALVVERDPYQYRDLHDEGGT